MMRSIPALWAGALLALAQPTSNLAAAHLLEGHRPLAQAWCSDSATQQAARQRQLDQAQRQVRQRQTDLHKAQRQGDARQILKRQFQLNQAQQQLHKARRPPPSQTPAP
jgi:hypothetical protein